MTSSLPEAGRLKCNPAQRRVEVYLLSKNGLPNREIARRLNCDEGTVRRDLKFLRTPASERPPLKEPRPKKVKIITPEQRLRQFLRAAKEWFPSEGLIRPDILFVTSEAARHLYVGEGLYSHPADPTLNPAELLLQAAPATPINIEGPGSMPERLEYCTNWFARWVALNWPRDEKTRDEVLKKMTLWAEQEL